MKDARFYLEKIPIRMLDEDIIEQIKQAQKDAYNQAIEDAVKNFEVKINRNYPYEITRHDFYLDNNSILKLKIK